jgi:hypothetical protein
MSKKKKFASGGDVTAAGRGDRAVLLSRGLAVVSGGALATYGPDIIAKMNGGNTDVISASEALAEMDSEADHG